MTWLRALATVVAMTVTVLGATSAASAAPGFDPSFGVGGVVEFQPALPPQAPDLSVLELRASPDGGAYAIYAGAACEPGPCPTRLFRFRPNGTPDRAFNGPGEGVAVADYGAGAEVLWVDSEGRPVVGKAVGAKVRLTRFGLDGRPDPGFGAAGSVFLNCRCRYGFAGFHLRLRAAEAGKLLVSGYTKSQRKRPSRLWITRLFPDGSVDRGFGLRGATTVTVHKRDLVSLAVSPLGSIYLASAGCCLGVVRLQKVSARGFLDARFDARAARLLGKIRPVPPRATLMPRDDGRLDVFLNGRGGVTVRLRADGEPVRSFGRGGRLPGPSVYSAAPAGLGRTFAAVSRSGDDRLLRLLADGTVDPSFGGIGGFPIPGSERHWPIYVEPVDGDGAMVVDTGRENCRSGCSGDPPKFSRYLGL